MINQEPVGQSEAPIIPPAQSSSKKGLVIAIILIILIAAGYFLYKPGTKSASQEFMPKMSYVRVPDAENRALDFNANNPNILTNEDRKVLNDYFAGTAALSSTNAQAMLAKYSSVLALLDATASKKYYQCSVTMGDTCYQNVLVLASQLASLKSAALASQGNTSDAISYAQKAVSFGKEVTANSDSILNLLIGWIMQKTGYAALVAAKAPAPSADEKQKLITALRQEQKTVINFDLARHVEMIDYITSAKNKPVLMVLNADEDAAAQDYRKATTEVTWNPEETKQWFLSDAKATLANVDLPCGTVYTAVKSNSDFDPKDTSAANQKNFVGKMFYAAQYASLNSMNVKRCAVEQAIQAL